MRRAYEPNAFLARREEIAPGLVILRIAPRGWTLPPFTAGQFAVVGLPASAPRLPGSDPEEPGADPNRFIRRAYSIASSSRQREHVELYVNLVRSGELTPRLLALREGDPLWLGRKFTGMFTLRDVPPDRNLALVATGTGLAPYMSMLRTELDCSGRRKLAVLLGARHSGELGYSRELFGIQRECEHFAYLPIISRPAEEREPWTAAVGHVQDLWTGGALARAWGRRPSPADTHVFLCGNPAMIEDMTRLLQGEGYRVHAPRSPGEIHFERYW